MTHNAKRLAGMGCILLLGACGGGTDHGGFGGPGGAGGVSLELRIPSGNADGLALIRLDGGDLDSVAHVPGTDHRVGTPGQQLHVLIRAPLSGTVSILRACVKDIGDTASWPTPRLLQMAGAASSGYAVRDTSQYHLAFKPTSVTNHC